MKTIQSNIKQQTGLEPLKSSLFLGGINTQHEALKNETILKVGYPRIFVVRAPVFMELSMPDQTKVFNHYIETECKSLQGIGNLNMDFDQVQGGIVGDQFEVPTLLKDDTNEITLTLYDKTCSPVREYITMWLNGIADKLSGWGTYNGAIDNENLNLKYSQANQTMEIIYVQTDPTGRSNGIEYACLLTNMVPKTVRQDHLNWSTGQVNFAEMEIPFTCNKYESADINEIAKKLLDKYQIKQSYIDKMSGYTQEDIDQRADYQF